MDRENRLNDRMYWLKILTKVIDPVLSSAAERKLKELMPVANKSRSNVSRLEAIGRTLCGIAPWLELGPNDGEEGVLRQKYAFLAREAIDAATDPESPDYCTFVYDKDAGGQPLVDAAFLSHAIVRAPRELWEKLDTQVKKNLVKALKATRCIRPVRNNWLLFSAMVETALYIMGEEFDKVRVDYAIFQHEQWYKGDGVYGDGPYFHWDYYNSFVIHPMLIDVVNTLGGSYGDYGMELQKTIMERAQRYAAIQEMLISPEGTYPAVGRSITYRCGAFHLLAQMALIEELPERISPAQVRCALTAVIKNTLESSENYDSEGWLRIGVCGHQPGLAEPYISTGSLYLCTTAFLPLGLRPENEFWQAPPQKWTSQKIWSGEDMPADHAIDA
ncbi:DUF2264 domain-containing protein [Thermoclostridium stercorarium]|uniref:DUF2264 domain-containing protein n=1 Tax=Thermoclostridium stercorarium TaxID=1510 RepID=UPI0022491E75|nr:DUF2264 domain-containing protein [Thermoclostridium stercorarium]UZQ85020.1 DUF2264 domain-containing protein [Thermoclostridium stercorarium]